MDEFTMDELESQAQARWGKWENDQREEKLKLYERLCRTQIQLERATEAVVSMVGFQHKRVVEDRASLGSWPMVRQEDYVRQALNEELYRFGQRILRELLLYSKQAGPDTVDEKVEQIFHTSGCDPECCRIKPFDVKTGVPAMTGGAA